MRAPVDPQGGPARAHARRLMLSEKLSASVLLALVFGAVLAFGASDVGASVLFAGLYAVYLAGLLATCGWARRDLVRMRGLRTPALLFAILLAAILWPLSPFGPGGPHPVWDYLPGRPASLAIDRSALALNVIQFLGLACLLVAGRIIGVSEARGRWFLRAAVLVLGLYVAGAFLDHVAIRRSLRLAATLLSPNSAATVFGAGLFLAVAFTAYRLRRGGGLHIVRRGDPEAILGLGVAALLMIALLLTTSRGGLAATLMAGAVFLVWEAFSQRHRMKATAILSGVAAIILLAVLAQRSLYGVMERFDLIQHDATVRAAIFAPHWEAFRSAPWSGFGLGAFPTVNQLIVTQQTLPVLFDVRSVHNLYLQWLEEAGVVGAGAMLALFLGLSWPIFQAGFRKDVVGLWCRATICAAIVFLVHGITDFALQVPAIQALTALILGVVGGMVSGRRVSRTDSAPAWPIPVGVGGALFVVVIAGLAALPIVVGKMGGDLSAWPSAPADALARRIEAELTQPGLGAERLRRLKVLSDRELSMRPASGSAWLRRAAIDSALGDDAQASLALERSFAVAPLQTSLFATRTRFAYEHWDRLSPSARTPVIYQFETEWRRRASPPFFVAMANSLHNPAGRIGMALQITVLRLEPPPPPRSGE